MTDDIYGHHVEAMLDELRIGDAVRPMRIIEEDQLSYLSYRAFSAGFTAAINYYGVTPGEYDGYDAGQKWSEWNDELWHSKNGDVNTAEPDWTDSSIASKDATTSMIKEILAQ